MIILMTDIDLKNKILNTLMFKEETLYSELEKITDNHDLFNYHLKDLINKGLVEKENNKYRLSISGRQTVALMEEDGKYQKQYKVGMFINLIRKVNGKKQILLYRRLKHPHFGYVGSVSCKLTWGSSLTENLKRELFEELGIELVKYEIIGVNHELFQNEKGELVGDGIFFVSVVTEWKGEPAEKSIEGDYFWCDIDNVFEVENLFKESMQQRIPEILKYLENPDTYQRFVFENGFEKCNF